MHGYYGVRENRNVKVFCLIQTFGSRPTGRPNNDSKIGRRHTFSCGPKMVLPFARKFVWLSTIESLPSSKINTNSEFWRYVRHISRPLYAAMQAPAEAPEDPWTEPTLCVNINNLYSSLPILKRQNSQLHWAGWNPTWTACLSAILRVWRTHEKLAPESGQVCVARVHRNHYCDVLSPTLSSMVFMHNSRCIVNHRTSSVARTAPCTNDNKLSSQPAPSRLPDGRPALPDNKRLCTGSMHSFRSGTLCYGEQFGK